MKSLEWKNPPEMQIDPAKKYRAVIQTVKGTIELELYPEHAPKTGNNFVFLAKMASTMVYPFIVYQKFRDLGM